MGGRSLLHINEHCYLCLAAIDFYGRKMSQILLKCFEGIIEHMDGSYSVENVYSSFRLKKPNKPNKKPTKIWHELSSMTLKDRGREKVFL